MTQEELIRFLKRVYVWIPQRSPMRAEIEQLVTKLGGRVSKIACQEEQNQV